YLLKEGGAHAGFEGAVKNVPVPFRGKKPKGTPYSLWELLEHMRIAQWDILEFSRSAKHASPKWPDEYWPESSAPPSAAAWSKSVKQFLADRDAMCKLVSSDSAKLYSKIPHGDGQTLLREALLVADHNAYHLGQFIMLRKVLGSNP